MRHRGGKARPILRVHVRDECLDEQAAVDWLEGRMTAGTRVQAQAHVDDCAPCRRLIAAVAVVLDDGATELRPSPGVVPPAGTVIGGYRIARRLGTGAMGVVMLAEDPRLRRPVALKLVRSADTSLDRVRREGRSLARLSDPHVVTVLACGDSPWGAYIAMEYVDGWTLGEWRVTVRRDPDAWLAALRAAGRGLSAAHRAGVVHGDFKPSNVLVGRDGRIRVADFGLARSDASLDPTAEAAEGATLARGTPGYMAPEVIEGRRPDARADQFSFCVTAWELLAGARPFRGASLEALAASMRTDRPHGVPPVAARVRRALERGLDPDPARRHDDMDALLRRLDSPRPRVGRAVAIVSVGAALIALMIAAGTPDDGDLGARPAASVEARWDDEAASALRLELAEAKDRWPTRGSDDAHGVFVELVRRADATGDPRIRAEARLALAQRESWGARGEEARRVLEEAYFLALEADAARIGWSAALELAQAYGHRAQRFEDAELWIARARSLLARMPGDTEIPLQRTDKVHGELLLSSGRDVEARELLLAALERLPEDASPRERATLHASIGGAYAYAQEAEPALEHFSRALEIQRAAEEIPDIELSRPLNGLAVALTLLGRYDEAIAAYDEAIALLDGHGGASEIDRASAQSNVGALYAMKGDHEAALHWYRLACDGTERRDGGIGPEVGACRYNIATALFHLRRDEEAIRWAQGAIDAYSLAQPPLHALTVRPLWTLAQADRRLGRLDAAARATSQRIAIRLEHGVGDTLDLVDDRLDLASIERESGREADADAMLAEAEAELATVTDADPEDLAETRSKLHALRQAR